MAEPLHHLASLLTRIAAGDRRAFGIFFDETYRTVSSWIDPLLASDARDDLVVAAYLQVWASAPSFPGSASTVIGWLASTTAPALVARPSEQAAPRPRRNRLPGLRLRRANDRII